MAILTISRQMGSEGLQIGKTVAEQIGYDFFDKEKILDQLKQDGPLWEETGRELDERNPSLWEKYEWQYRGLIALEQSHILDCALRDRVVIIGRGGNFLLEGIPYALRTLVVAPMEVRLKRVTEEKTCADFICIDPKLAHSILEKADRESDELMHSEFGKRWDDPSGYDVIFNLETLSVEEVAATLKAMLARRDAFKNTQAESELKKRAVAAKINAAILTNPAVSIPTLEVMNVDEGILLRGLVHNAKEHKLIEDQAKKLAGNVPVKCELHYR
ncbi:MAG TPA: cytidylate kinase-like family protein [Syntrophorhabdaceae bacterium]|nr:cytidylate kinase-like family protein [Syntrophorhabdaceae bacterium]